MRTPLQTNHLITPCRVRILVVKKNLSSLHTLLLLQDTRLRRHEDELRAARLAKLSLFNQVSEALYGAQLDLDQILQAVLVCMTAGQGLRFNRAFLLLVGIEDGRSEEIVAGFGVVERKV